MPERPVITKDSIREAIGRAIWDLFYAGTGAEKYREYPAEPVKELTDVEIEEIRAGPCYKFLTNGADPSQMWEDSEILEPRPVLKIVIRSKPKDLNVQEDEESVKVSVEA